MSASTLSLGRAATEREVGRVVERLSRGNGLTIERAGDPRFDGQIRVTTANGLTFGICVVPNGASAHGWRAGVGYPEPNYPVEIVCVEHRDGDAFNDSELMTAVRYAVLRAIPRARARKGAAGKSQTTT